jgi:hypothetical protein
MLGALASGHLPDLERALIDLGLDLRQLLLAALIGLLLL